MWRDIEFNEFMPPASKVPDPVKVDYTMIYVAPDMDVSSLSDFDLMRIWLALRLIDATRIEWDYEGTMATIEAEMQRRGLSMNH